MSISSEITRISNAKTAIAQSIANKGVTVPSGTKIDGMAALIDSIQTGGGGAVQPSKALTVTSNGTTTITPDAPYDAIKQVDLTVNVASGGGGSAGYKVTFPATATNWHYIDSERSGLLLSDGTIKPLHDYSNISGQTVENVIGIACNGNTSFYVLEMTLSKGTMAQYIGRSTPITLNFNITTAPNTTPISYAIGTSTFWWPLSDVVISSIQMYNTD